MHKTLLLAAAILLAAVIPVSALNDYEGGLVDEGVLVTGTLSRAAAIGGETTGWLLLLDSALNGQQQIEIDPMGNDIAGFEDRHVLVGGALEKRIGTERGEYRLLRLKEISLVEQFQSYNSQSAVRRIFL